MAGSTETDGSTFFRLGGDEEENADEVNDCQEFVVMCLNASGGNRIGGAFYDAQDAILHLVQDFNDDTTLTTTLSLLSTVRPAHLVVCSNQNNAFLDMIKKYAPETSQAEATAPIAINSPEVHWKPSKDFALSVCTDRLMRQKLPAEKESGSDLGDQESVNRHRLLMHGLVDFAGSPQMVKSAGALLNFIDRNNESGEGAMVLAIRRFVLPDVVSVDQVTLSALQIFNSNWQPSGCKAGNWNRMREGLSLFKVLNRCKSVAGTKKLRQFMRSLPRDLRTIQDRQASVNFFSHPDQLELCKALQKCLSNIKNVPRCLRKLSNNQASVKDWKTLVKSVNNMVALCEISQHPTLQEPMRIPICEALRAACTEEVKAIRHHLDNTLDMERSHEKGQAVVRCGVDEDLDELRRLHNGLPDLLEKVIFEDINTLPEELESAYYSYIPMVGFLLAARLQNPELTQTMTEEQWEGAFPGLNFELFEGGVPHFKNGRCRQLDAEIGDTFGKISEREIEITVHLSNFILARTEQLMEIVDLSSELDVLLSMAQAGVEQNWRPAAVVARGDLDIVAGRHPLQEIVRNEPFVPNSTLMCEDPDDHSSASRGKSERGDGRGSGGGKTGQRQTISDMRPRGKVVVLTGPNACGKSVYLKQVGLIVYMAHLGCWIPAESATVPLFDAIYTRIQTVESMELGLSAFMVDLNQMAHAITTATPRSLVLVDEFGKGTAEVDGESLLAACIDHWLSPSEGLSPPHVIICTHFQSIKSRLQPISIRSQHLVFQTFAFETHGGESIFLYLMHPGTCVSSHAMNVARKAGIDEAILGRSQQVLEAIQDCRPVPMGVNSQGSDTQKMEEIGDNFLDLELGSRDSFQNLVKMLRSI